MCENCISLDDLCLECQELRDSHDADIAHGIVDYGNLIYKNVWHLPLIQKDGEGHQWTERDGELKEQIYDITNRLAGWLFLGKHIVPLVQQDELSAYLHLPSTDTICIQCHLQVNRFVGCQSCITPSQSLYNEIHKVMCS